MSVISAGTTTTTAFKVTGDTTGTLQLQTGAVPTTAINISATQVVTFPATTTLDFTGTLLLGDGSAAAPTLAHSGDTNTGMFFPAADTIAFTEGGTEALRINSSANVGIGTTNPSTRLHVVGSGNPTITLAGSDAAYTSIFSMVAAGGGSSKISATGGSNQLIFATNSLDRVAIDSSGNLGLGVTPSAWNSYRALQLGGGGSLVSFGNAAEVWSNAFFNGTNNVYIANGFATRYHANNNGAHAWYNAPSGTAGNGITFTQAMTLDSNGNLGVGSTAPTNSVGFKTLSLSGSTGGQIAFQQSNVDRAYIFHDATNFHIYNLVSGPLVFSTSNAERARITTNGRLSIGSTSEAGMVYVNSGALDETIRLQGSGSPFLSMFQGSTRNLYLEVSTNVQFWIETNKALRFATNNTERARITSGGSFCVNTTNAAFLLNVHGTNGAHFGDDYDGANYGVVQISRPANQGSAFHLSFVRTGHQVAGMGFLNNSSTFAVQNGSNNGSAGVTLVNGGTSWGSTSDEREKNILGNVENAADKLASWRSVYFRYKIDKNDAPQRIGLIAQDVQATVPEAISVGDDEAGTLQLRYSEVIPVLVKAIQELSAKVAALESK